MFNEFMKYKANPQDKKIAEMVYMDILSLFVVLGYSITEFDVKRYWDAKWGDKKFRKTEEI